MHFKILIIFFLTFFIFEGVSLNAQIRDPGFGFNGFVKADLEGYGYDRGLKVLIQDDNKILSIGSAAGHPIYGPKAITIIRYAYNGEPDSSFAEDGIKIVRVNNNDTFYESILLQSDQKIVLAGQYQTSRFVLRLNTDGSLDSSFAEDGILNFDADSNYYDYYSLNILEDDKILLLRRYKEDYYANYSYELHRYNTDGSLDTDYADMGVKALALPDSGNFLLGNDYLFDNDELLLMGRRYTSDEFGYEYTHFAMVKTQSNGDLDSSFGESGAVIHANMVTSEMELQSDGKIVCAGSVGTNPQGTLGNMGVMRFNINGSVDSSFSDDGFQSINIDSYADYANALEIQNDGKLIIGGSFFNFGGGSGTDCALVRLNSDGSFDDSYGDEGVYETGVSSGTDQVIDMLIQDQNKVVFVGYANYATFDIVTVRIIMQGLSTSPDLTICPGESATLSAYSDSAIIGWANANDPDSLISSNSSISVSPSENTSYLVYTSDDTASVEVSLAIAPYVNLGVDTMLCLGEDYLLSSLLSEGSFLWQDSSTANSYLVESEGVYWLEVSTVCFSERDSIYVDYNELNIDLGADLNLCYGDSVLIDATYSGATYLWNTESTDAAIWVAESGRYIVELTYLECVVEDSLDVEVFELSSSSIEVETCNEYLSPSGNYIWNESGIYQDTLTNVEGCDSIINVDLTVYELGPEISLQGATLSVNLEGIDYQWIDCSTNMPIENANEQSFSPLENGSYAVELSNGECIELSECLEVNSVGISEIDQNVDIDFYPNPTSGFLRINFSKAIDGYCEVYNLKGQQILRTSIKEQSISVDMSAFPASLYFVKVLSTEGMLLWSEKVLKE